jgi:hypothetical protein
METALCLIAAVLFFCCIGALERRHNRRWREERLRERELDLRERELELKEREERRNRPPPPYRRLAPLLTDEHMAKMRREHNGTS